MRTTFASFAFGCRVNEAEKILFNRKLIDKGFTYSENKPDLYIINSCAVTQKAEREIRQHIYQIRKKFPKTKIIVTGCAATFWLKNKNVILERSDGICLNKSIDLLISNSEKQLLTNKIIEFLSLRGVQRTTWQSIANKEDRHALQARDDKVFPDKFLDSGRLIIKIQDGCQRYCSYCLVPYLRGKPTSKTIAEILNEISQFKHVQEVILSAINTEYFGHNNNETLIELIKEIIIKTKIPRISLGSLHPWSLTDKFIGFYKEILPLNRLVNFFHIPIQSGSEKILKLMNRGTTIYRYIDKLERIKKINPHAFISTDIIVGFPGETRTEFAKTYKFLEKAPVDKFHVFRFSKRSGTTAEILIKQHGQPTDKEKIFRSKKLRELSNKKYREFIKTLRDKPNNVLVLKEKVGKYHQGLLSNQIPILLKK